ncbi:hypothetical protein FIBSPDRAFT_359826 [Athelia psychrophila]|uniref:Uncharacterized protein n=1 Tax=Athelia psychrophila TaxID=1759441 RepID=A0A167VPY4_9AGAM|nr:hypothetical protein FIBSPDRAFT_359826 [Fibularhizoctonia sp. CBS 109695]
MQWIPMDTVSMCCLLAAQNPWLLTAVSKFPDSECPKTNGILSSNNSLFLAGSGAHFPAISSSCPSGLRSGRTPKEVKFFLWPLRKKFVHETLLGMYYVRICGNQYTGLEW